MTQYISKATLVAELNRLIAELVEEGEDTMFEQGRISAFEDVKVFINHTLEVKEIHEDVGFNIGDDITVNGQVCRVVAVHYNTLKELNFWKPADGDDLPEIDKEVIALIETFGHYKVIFAHRVDENAEIRTSIDGKPLVLHPKRHDKGGWNIPNVKFWLDCELPKIEE